MTPPVEEFTETVDLRAPQRTGQSQAVDIKHRQLAPIDLGDDAGAGLEEMGMDALITPFLRILQSGSPQVKETEGAYVPGARPGMLFDTATQEYYEALVHQGAAADAGTQLVICYADQGFGIWVPRDLDGGFRGMVPLHDPIVLGELKRIGGSKFNLPRYKKDTGWTSRGQKCDPSRVNGEDVELVETINYYVLYAPQGETIAADNARRAIVRFTSTALQVAQGVNTMMKNWVYRAADASSPAGYSMRPAAIYSYRWRMRTVAQAKGANSWFNYRLDRDPVDAKPPLDPRNMIAASDPLRALGREFYELAKAGKVKADEGAAARDDDAPPF